VSALIHQPRPYQAQAIDELRDGIKLHRRPDGLYDPGLLVAPTGSGKSEIFAWMARSAVAKGKRVGVGVNRRILVNDLCKRVERTGLGYGVIMGGTPSKRWEPVQVASLDTLWRRDPLPTWDIFFWDEAHFSLAKKYITVAERLIAAGTVVIGLTATPIRGASEGLGAVYKWMVRCPDTPDLIEAGYLVKPRLFAPGEPDLKKVETVAGEYNQRQLAEACDQRELTGDILKHWLTNLRGRPTLGFGVDINHCKHMAEMFCGAGIRAGHIDHTFQGDMDAFWRKLANYETEVVFNVGMAGYGFDCPPVSGMIDGAPSQSLGRCIQRWGRIMRPCEGKIDAIINDHAGNYHRHGAPHWPREWSLENGIIVPADGDAAAKLTTCKRPVPMPSSGVPSYFKGPVSENRKFLLPCFAVFPAGRDQCPYCGLPIEVQARKVEVADGDLQEVTAPPPPKSEQMLAYEERMRKRYLELVNIARNKTKKDGSPWSPRWATMAFKAEFHRWPKREWIQESRANEPSERTTGLDLCTAGPF